MEGEHLGLGVILPNRLLDLFDYYMVHRKFSG
jgi:hypothetical protein